MNIIDIRPRNPKEKVLAVAMLPFRRFLPNNLIEQWCRDSKYCWRERLWGPVVTLLGCLWKHGPNSVGSVREVEDAFAGFRGDVSGVRRDGRDFCNARARLPEKVFKTAVSHTGALASSLAPLLFRNMAVFFADSTTLRLANSKSNAQAFGRSPTLRRKFGRATLAGLSRSPLMRLALLTCAGCGAVLASAMGSYDTSEQALFMQLLDLLPSGLLIADRAFSTYLNFCLLLTDKRQFLARLRDDRKTRRVKRLGKNDALHLWTRPSPHWSHYPELIRECPAEIELRVVTGQFERKGYRTWTLRVVTTLLDPKRYPAEELIELHLKRWRMETTLRTLKTNMGMARLWAKTPDVARKEVHSTFLAHNCTVALMGMSGQRPENLSMKRARSLAMGFAAQMSFAATVRLPELFQTMLGLIATALQPPQDRPPEPRALIQHESTFPVLSTSRLQWKQNYRAA